MSQLDETPIPKKNGLRSSIRKTCQLFDNDPDCLYILDKEEISLEHFFNENYESMSANEFYNIFSLNPGEVLILSGGASPTRILKRVR